MRGGTGAPDGGCRRTGCNGGCQGCSRPRERVGTPLRLFGRVSRYGGAAAVRPASAARRSGPWIGGGRLLYRLDGVTEATLDPEDNKLVVLARATRARNGTAEGAAVRDEIGRTYTASEVNLPSLTLTAVQAAVVMAACSGARSLEAAALVTEADAPSEADLRAIRDMSAGTLFLAGPDGTVKGRHG